MAVGQTKAREFVCTLLEPVQDESKNAIGKFYG